MSQSQIPICPRCGRDSVEGWWDYLDGSKRLIWYFECGACQYEFDSESLKSTPDSSERIETSSD